MISRPRPAVPAHIRLLAELRSAAFDDDPAVLAVAAIGRHYSSERQSLRQSTRRRQRDNLALEMIGVGGATVVAPGGTDHLLSENGRQAERIRLHRGCRLRQCRRRKLRVGEGRVVVIVPGRRRPSPSYLRDAARWSPMGPLFRVRNLLARDRDLVDAPGELVRLTQIPTKIGLSPASHYRGQGRKPPIPNCHVFSVHTHNRLFPFENAPHKFWNQRFIFFEGRQPLPVLGPDDHESVVVAIHYVSVPHVLFPKIVIDQVDTARIIFDIRASDRRWSRYQFEFYRAFVKGSYNFL
mmetsp:Transcript_2944/g.6128  ORF Transcript_2944/g.6128 Transcript_2944/m.6128 type:complete len:295 (+) Transcript_2944:111-995(+)